MHKISLHRTTVPCVQTALVFVGTLLSPAVPTSAAESPSVSSFALAAPRPPGQFVYGTHLWHEGQRGMSRQLYRTPLVPNSHRRPLPVGEGTGMRRSEPGLWPAGGGGGALRRGLRVA